MTARRAPKGGATAGKKDARHRERERVRAKARREEEERTRVRFVREVEVLKVSAVFSRFCCACFGPFFIWGGWLLCYPLSYCVPDHEEPAMDAISRRGG